MNTTIIATTSMGLLLGVIAPLGVADGSIWAQWGLAGLIVSYTLWRDHQRERRMAKAVEKQNQWMRETMHETIKHNTAALHTVIRYFGDQGTAVFTKGDK